jgi:hypothetical protein
LILPVSALLVAVITGMSHGPGLLPVFVNKDIATPPCPFVYIISMTTLGLPPQR